MYTHHTSHTPHIIYHISYQALASGLCDGLGMGSNTKAAVVSKQ